MNFFKDHFIRLFSAQSSCTDFEQDISQGILSQGDRVQRRATRSAHTRGTPEAPAANFHRDMPQFALPSCQARGTSAKDEAHVAIGTRSQWLYPAEKEALDISPTSERHWKHCPLRPRREFGFREHSSPKSRAN